MDQTMQEAINLALRLTEAVPPAHLTATAINRAGQCPAVAVSREMLAHIHGNTNLASWLDSGNSEAVAGHIGYMLGVPLVLAGSIAAGKV